MKVTLSSLLAWKLILKIILSSEIKPQKVPLSKFLWLTVHGNSHASYMPLQSDRALRKAFCLESQKRREAEWGVTTRGFAEKKTKKIKAKENLWLKESNGTRDLREQKKRRRVEVVGICCLGDGIYFAFFEAYLYFFKCL